MKKLLFIALVAICGAFTVNAQTAKFGLKAGYVNISAKEKYQHHVLNPISANDYAHLNFLHIPVLPRGMILCAHLRI